MLQAMELARKHSFWLVYDRHFAFWIEFPFLFCPTGGWSEYLYKITQGSIEKVMELSFVPFEACTSKFNLTHSVLTGGHIYNLTDNHVEEYSKWTFLFDHEHFEFTRIGDLVYTRRLNLPILTLVFPSDVWTVCIDFFPRARGKVWSKFDIKT